MDVKEPSAREGVMSVTPPGRAAFDIADAGHRARVVDAVSGGAPMGYWFGNFCVIGSRPARSAFLRINRAKGRPDEQPGSVVTTPERLTRMFDWSLLPGGLDRGAVVGALDALVGLGPIGMRGPATDTIPDHLSAWDKGVRTVQVVLPGQGCPSNILVDDCWTGIGGDVIFGTSANVLKLVTGRVTPSHNEMRAFVAECGGWPDMVFVGPADEAATRPPPIHPGSTSFFPSINRRHGRACGGGAWRHGPLAPDVIPVAGNHGLPGRRRGSHQLPMPNSTPAPVLMSVDMTHRETVPGPHPTWADEVRSLARRKDAVLLALATSFRHPDVADHTGDSPLSRIAARSSAPTIVIPRALRPRPRRSSPRQDSADSRRAGGLLSPLDHRRAAADRKAEPGAVVVSYASPLRRWNRDRHLPPRQRWRSSSSIPSIGGAFPTRPVPAPTRRLTRENMHLGRGATCMGINGAALTAQAAAHPDAELFVHPECGCATSALYLAGAGAVPAERVKILSTGGMLEAARRSSAATVLVDTEVGMLHQLRRAAPEVTFRAVNERASCRYMKMITPEALLRSLRQGTDEVHVEPALATRARAAVQSMIEIGRLGGAE